MSEHDETGGGDGAPLDVRARLGADFGQRLVSGLVMGAVADAADLSTPFLVGATLLTATAWQCRRQANVAKDI